ncbi:50S ribosomal protein L16 [Candidatus Woesearchaeota archaeon]|nr:MAG: large subunit ribosomal protein L10e [archaeon GW2011_AR4]MBS3129696.1 50S ribosomal protein L16 [Candidatus Woesearchaeota archaeon]HIH38800.1 50S ribosomal protein L16 [Candidatus Woesearchaeota archaeon]HIH49215.1 50S ribosomal protein L16 [Candidatus Woesearchaeota archaeon]HIJ03358.1 50S ribosomal protein L16 [Candidatus Woesearchaeota archaeon]
MAKLRKFSAYQRLERPYTRKSKYKEKQYVRAFPNLRIVHFDMGDLQREFPLKIDLISKRGMQVRHNAIESARLTTNRYLEKSLGKKGYNLKIRIYPHHVLRENPLASGAGADRMSTGMKKSFGKPIGAAARVQEGQILMTVSVPKTARKIGVLALKRASYKVPMPCSIQESA